MSGFGMRHEPPSDPHERAKLIEMYWQELTARAKDEFTDLKQSLHDAAKFAVRYGNMPPPQTELNKLESLRAVFAARQKKLASAREEVRRTTPEAKRRLEGVKASCRRSGEGFLGDLNKIKL